MNNTSDNSIINSALKRKSKWNKYKVMRKYEELKSHIPRTQRMTDDNLWNLVAKYGDVVVKPTNGGRGYGVIRVRAVASNIYELNYENMKITFKGKERATEFIKEKIKASKYSNYIVQYRIPLATVGSRPFDMRVVVQRKQLSDPWELTGIVAKVAGHGYIVTNIQRSSGKVLPIQTAIGRSKLKDSYAKVMSEIARVALLSAEKLSNNSLYTNQRIFGFDMGIDQKGRVWIIEANLNPMLSHFRKLKDKSIYRKILEYKQG